MTDHKMETEVVRLLKGLKSNAKSSHKTFAVI